MLKLLVILSFFLSSMSALAYMQVPAAKLLKWFKNSPGRIRDRCLPRRFMERASPDASKLVS